MNKNFLSIDDWDNKTHIEFLHLTNEIKEGKYNDTNQMFEKPSSCTFEIKNFDYQDVIKEIRDKL